MIFAEVLAAVSNPFDGNSPASVARHATSDGKAPYIGFIPEAARKAVREAVPEVPKPRRRADHKSAKEAEGSTASAGGQSDRTRRQRLEHSTSRRSLR
jgi:hypothetical protein